MSQTQLLSVESPTVSIYEGRPAVDSLQVAKFFGKPHDKVMRDIRNLKGNCPESFTDANFGVSEYMDTTGRKLPMFLLYRDGFMLLVMGYTGKKALAMKLAYIDAFNAMEQALKQSTTKAIPQTTTPSTADSRKPLRALVHAWSQVTGVHHAALWPQVKAHFQLSRIDDLPEEWIPDALAFVQSKIDAQQAHVKAIEPTPAPAAPAIPSAPDVTVKGRRTKPYNTIREIMSAFEQAHTDCVFAQAPEGYSHDDKAGALRFAIQEELYKNCMASLRAAQFALAASSRVAEWA